MRKTLIFVYNAQSDAWSKLIGMAHKIMSPSTYSCGLCSLTHDNFSENNVWRSFRERAQVEFVFMYKDEFVKEYGSCYGNDFPIILNRENNTIDVLLTSNELTDLKSTHELIEILNKEI